MKKIKQLFFLIFCAVYFLFRGRARKKIIEPKAILVAQLAKMGDMVCTTPVFRAIKKRFPSCKVYVLGDSVNEELLKDNRDVNGYFAYKRNFFETLRILRKEKFDFACLTGPGPKILTILYLAGIPAIAATIVTGGFSPQQSRVYKMLTRFALRIPHRMEQYAPREYLRLLTPIGIFSHDTEKHLAYSENAERKAREFLETAAVKIGRDFLVGIAPGTGENRVKLWGSLKFARIADHLYKNYRAKIFIIGGSRDKKEAEEMVTYLNPATPVINTCEMFNIDELKAFIARLSLLISVDTGPIYIAEALRIPTIDIVGPVDEREQPPIGERHVVIAPPSRIRPESYVMNSRVMDFTEAKRQSDSITAEMVIRAADELIKKLKLSSDS